MSEVSNAKHLLIVLQLVRSSFGREKVDKESRISDSVFDSVYELVYFTHTTYLVWK